MTSLTIRNCTNVGIEMSFDRETCVSPGGPIGGALLKLDRLRADGLAVARRLKRIFAREASRRQKTASVRRRVLRPPEGLLGPGGDTKTRNDLIPSYVGAAVWLLFYILLLMNGDHRADHSQRAAKVGAADAANMTVLEATRVRALRRHGEVVR